MEYKISIIIPIYKVKDKILRVLDSLKAQTFKEFEALFIDDGSLDNSSEFVHNYLKNSHVIYRIIKKENNGVSSAKNLGIKESKGEYIQFLDSDDYMDKDMLKDLYKKAIETDSDIVYSGCVCEEGNRTKILDNMLGLKEGILSGKEAVLRYIYGMSYTSIASGLFRRSLLIDNNIRFDANKNFAENIVFIVNAYRHSKRVYCVKRIYFHYVKLEGSAMNNISLDNYYSNLELLDYVTKNFNDVDIETAITKNRIPVGIVKIFITFSRNKKLKNEMYEFIKQEKVRKYLSQYRIVKRGRCRIKYLILSKLLLHIPGIVAKYYKKQHKAF